jgi:hypothetical protein
MVARRLVAQREPWAFLLAFKLDKKGNLRNSNWPTALGAEKETDPE